MKLTEFRLLIESILNKKDIQQQLFPDHKLFVLPLFLRLENNILAKKITEEDEDRYLKTFLERFEDILRPQVERIVLKNLDPTETPQDAYAQLINNVLEYFTKWLEPELKKTVALKEVSKVAPVAGGFISKLAESSPIISTSPPKKLVTEPSKLKQAQEKAYQASKNLRTSFSKPLILTQYSAIFKQSYRKIYNDEIQVKVADSLSRLLRIEGNPVCAVAVLSRQITNKPRIIVGLNSDENLEVKKLVQEKLSIVKEFIKVLLKLPGIGLEGKKKVAAAFAMRILAVDGARIMGAEQHRRFFTDKDRLTQDLLKVSHRMLLPLEAEVIVPQHINGRSAHGEQVVLDKLHTLDSEEEIISSERIIIGISKLSCGDCDDILQTHKKLSISQSTIMYSGTHRFYFPNVHRWDSTVSPAEDPSSIPSTHNDQAHYDSDDDIEENEKVRGFES